MSGGDDESQRRLKRRLEREERDRKAREAIRALNRLYLSRKETAWLLQHQFGLPISDNWLLRANKKQPDGSFINIGPPFRKVQNRTLYPIDGMHAWAEHFIEHGDVTSG